MGVFGIDGLAHNCSCLGCKGWGHSYCCVNATIAVVVIATTITSEHARCLFSKATCKTLKYHVELDLNVNFSSGP